MVFGIDNYWYRDARPVFVLIKYDKSFRKISQCDISNCYTVDPFGAGSLNMAEKDNTLIIHTSRGRYDGHQSNMTFIIDTATMTVMNSEDLGEWQKNHVSHSFNQFVTIDAGSNAYLLDHGDAYPRSLILRKAAISGGRFSYNLEQKNNNYNRSTPDYFNNIDDDDDEQYYAVERYFDEATGNWIEKDNYSYNNVSKQALANETSELIKFIGKTGANQTGLSVGNMVQGSRNLLIGVNHIDYSKANYFDSYVIKGKDVDKRDVFVFVVNKDNISSFQKIRLTDYSKEKGKPQYSEPKIVQLSDDRYMVMWNKYYKNKLYLCYTYINQDGVQQSDIKSIKDVELSRTSPAYIDGKIMWHAEEEHSQYSLYSSRSLLYTLPVD